MVAPNVLATRDTASINYWQLPISRLRPQTSANNCHRTYTISR
jgi:hypothetical protein